MISLPQLDRTIFVSINADWSNSYFDVIMPWITRLADAASVWLWIVFIGLLMGSQITHSVKAGQGKAKPSCNHESYWFILSLHGIDIWS